MIRLYKDFDNRVILCGGGGLGEQNVRKEGKGFMGVGGGRPMAPQLSVKGCLHNSDIRLFFLVEIIELEVARE